MADGFKDNSRICRSRQAGWVLQVALLSFFVAPGASAVPIFVNEFHYDNTGIDSGEFIEVAGQAGTDLTDWQIVLYNGSTGVSYNTQVLSGVIPNEQQDFGALSFNYPTNGIQNGAPDGIALVDPGGNVEQFISYEGSFVAVGGPANGLSSVPIVPDESPPPETGVSLQLTGIGRNSEDFVWSGPMAQTPGQINVLSTPTDLYFSEYVEGSGNNKALEIFNGTGTDIDLGDYQVEIYFNGSENVGSFLNLAGDLTSDTVYVVADDEAEAALASLADQLFRQNFFNGNDAVALRKISDDILIDIIGVIGVDDVWGDGILSTFDNTLRRRAWVTGGLTDDRFFDPQEQWSGAGLDNFAGLGSRRTVGQVITAQSEPVPAPSSLALVLLGVGVLIVRRSYKDSPQTIVYIQK